VLSSSSGRELLDEEGISLLRTRLLPLVDWITPNLAELSILTGRPVHSRADLLPAARELQLLAPNLKVVATGGHLNPPDDLLLTQDGKQHWLPGKHIDSHSTHGTGCAHSSALLARLLLGDSPLAAATAAKFYVAGAIRTATAIGSGHGPLNHLWLRQLPPSPK
jgi:hydroxymethylpyrimidine/phosphomethylpyrimidine kinase